MEDDRGAEKGELDRRQEGWKMTAEWGGEVSLAARRDGSGL